jgi:hypothetical protein
MTILDWLAAHPLLGFALAWPTALTLVAFAWTVAGVITNMISLVSALGSLTVVLVRGYPPETTTTAEDDDDDSAPNYTS